MKTIVEAVGGLLFCTFIAGKVTAVFATWSWWWVLMPAVPVIAKMAGWA